MKKEDLRPVKYSLLNPKDRGFNPDEEESKNEEKLFKMRTGRFHCWSPSQKNDPKQAKLVPCMVALVEDESSGKIEEIYPENIIFIND